MNSDSDFPEITIDQDRVPVNLNEAVDIIKNGLSPEAIKWMESSSPHETHFGLGMYIRNAWSLWNPDTLIVKWFEGKYGLTHADDISGIILDCVWQDIKNQPRRDEQLAKDNKIYWEVLEKAEKDGMNVNITINYDGTIKIEPEDNKNEK